MVTLLSVSKETEESCARVMKGLEKGSYKQQILKSKSVPFSLREPYLLNSFCRFVDSRNFREILNCKGV